MLGRVLAIALNTYRESVRARILLGLAGVAFAVAFYSITVGAYTLRQSARVVSDLGVASISVFGVAVAIIIGATSLHRELEQKTLFPILARPIRRGEYLVGKYLGTLLTVAVFVAADVGLLLLICAGIGGASLWTVLGAGLAAVVAIGVAAWRIPPLRTYGFIPWAVAMLAFGIALSGVSPGERRVLLVGSGLALLEVGIIAAWATFFASFSTPFLSSVLTLGMLLVGRNADDLAKLPRKYFPEWITVLGKGVAKVVPNLQIYVPARPLLAGEAADVHLPTYLGWTGIHALAWTVGLLAVATFIFKRRDFL
ncbi:ABC transporter permease subunit [Chondromyces apiculatus]|uniref:ABC transporter permease n=1 Tax=Chondromyces apiculatus DSM 436 TaxID=1192034 RepID=A0A017TC90_9BACT|nr:ABC transporter permease subunit [Chondromyces apiculatus]EYF06231.1 Hypothetical protein CAP_2109 [Chondromyces apiculatus DSM 436]